MNQNFDIQTLVSGSSRPYRTVLIFGPPGSGKGTLGKFLSSAGNHFHLSSGAIFRGIPLESPAGKLFHSYAGKGYLLPDDITVGIWHHYVEGLIATNRYLPHQQLLLLDGIPRTTQQALLLEQYIQIMHIIVLETACPNGLIKRIKRRALIERRLDDLDEGILKTRMEVYSQNIRPLLEYYSRHPSQVSYFKADARPLEILRDVLQKLSDLLSHSEESYI